MDNLIKLIILPTVIGLAGGIIASNTSATNSKLASSLIALQKYREQTLSDQPSVQTLKQPTNIPTPTMLLQPTTQPTSPPQPTNEDSQWGVAQKIGEHTYTIKVGNDDRMASPQEVFEALNAYRSTKGIGALSWDDKLAQYSQVRANTFKDMSNVDGHAGFNDYLENQNGFEQLGFMRLGENSYYGGALTGTHLIEWVFAQSPGHNANQLDTSWSHVGVGVTDTSVNLIFGGERM